MMSSSPPHNGTNNYNVNGTYNSQNLILTSSSTNDDELNLQLQNLENIEREHGNGSNVHFLDSNNLEIDQPNDLGLHSSNQSNFVTSHTNASNSDNSLTFDSIQANRTLDPNSEFIKNDAAVVNDYNRTDFLTNLDIDTPHYSNVNHQMDESEFEDFVPVSTNLHSNLQFPGSSSYLQVNSLASTSNSSSTSFSQSLSGNSLSSHLQNTPLQPSRKLPAPASHNTPFRTPSQIEINSPKRRSSFITPRVINSISTNSIHRRSKSKINITDESPAQGNPFYNPPSFLSPKVTKKSHRKTVSISNSISLSHLDADLNYQQQLYNNNNQSLIIDTPLRTPSERFVRNGDDLIDDEDEDAERVKHSDENEIEIANGQVDSNPAHLDGTTGNDSLNLLGNNMHTEQFGTRFGDRLIQSSQDLNRVLSNQPTNKNFNSKLSLSGEMIVKQPSPLLESTNFNTYLNDMLMDPATVESFGSDLFSFPQKDDSLINNDRNSSMESYYDSFENTFRQKQKSNYQSLKSANNTLLPPQMDIPLVSNASASSVPLVADLNQMSKSSSLPQSRENINDKSYGHHPTSSTVESKMQKSKSSFNLSNIAASREIKSPNYGYIKQEYPFSLDDSSFRMQSNQLSHSSAFIQLQQQSAYPSNYIVQDDSSTPMRNSIGIRTASLNMVAEKSHQRLTRSVCVLPSNASENNSPMASSSALKPVSNTSISESPIRNTRSKAHSDSLTTLNIKKPEKLDLPQQSKRSKSRSKKTANDDKKIHECPLCHMRFQRPEHVKRHMLSHSSERPFACPEEGCGKRFNRNDNLKQHLRNIHKRTL